RHPEQGVSRRLAVPRRAHARSAGRCQRLHLRRSLAVLAQVQGRRNHSAHRPGREGQGEGHRLPDDGDRGRRWTDSRAQPGNLVEGREGAPSRAAQVADHPAAGCFCREGTPRRRYQGLVATFSRTLTLSVTGALACRRALSFAKTNKTGDTMKFQTSKEGPLVVASKMLVQGCFEGEI